jgi:adhesin transport system membrane fusion protein
MNLVQEETPTKTEQGESTTHLFFNLCSILVITFFVWSYFGKLDVVSAAMGEVIPSSQVKHIQHLEGGIVREILVHEGDKVKKGQPMVSLEPVSSGADVKELNVRMNSLKVEIARLSAEDKGLKVPNFPIDIEREFPELIKEATSFFKTRMVRIKNQLDGQKQTIDEVSARIKNNRQQLTLLNEQIEISKELLKDQLSNRMQHLNLLKEASRLKGKIDEDTAGRKEALNKLETIRASFREKIQEDLEVKRRDLQEYTNRQKKYADSLNRTVLRSPVNGVVKSIFVATIGGVVAPGATVADVVPGGDRLIIEAKLPTQDIGYVHSGQEALVMLNSSDAGSFGSLIGKVLSISPDAIENADGIPYYKIRISTTKDYFQREAVKYQLVPGVQVTASIRTGQRSVLAYLTDPFLGSFRNALRER